MIDAYKNLEFYLYIDPSTMSKVIRACTIHNGWEMTVYASFYDRDIVRESYPTMFANPVLECFSNQCIVLHKRTSFIHEFYRKFIWDLLIPHNEVDMNFFCEKLYKDIFHAMDSRWMQWRMLQWVERKPSTNIPEEVQSALQITEEWMRLQKEILEKTETYKDKVDSHYRKYWTISDRMSDMMK